jgi:hypothetical protein
MIGPLTFSVIFSGALSIISLCFSAAMISEHSTSLIGTLQLIDFANVTVPTEEVMNQTQESQRKISQTANACATESSFYYSTLLAIRATNATKLNDTLCLARIAALEAKLFLVSMTLSQRNATILETGPGYTISSIFGVTYVTLAPQNAPVTHNGVISFDVSSRNCSSVFVRPLIGTQPTYFIATPPIVGYQFSCTTGELQFFTSDNVSGTAQLITPLSLLLS